MSNVAPDLILCDLPAEIINRTIETELEVGKVILSRAAQVHARREHPTDYPLCLPHIAAIIAEPLYIGDDLKNPGKIELIGRVAAIGAILVAVNVQLGNDGHYHVASFYLISEKKIEGRREKGFLKVAQPAASPNLRVVQKA